MVSLSRTTRQPGGGVTFFSDSLNSYHDDDPLLEAMPGLPQEPAVCRWMAEEVKKFRTIHTPKAIMLAKLLYVCLGLAAYLIPSFCQGNRCGQHDSTSLVLYVHGGMWFLLLLLHLYMYYEHRRSLLHGYFSFHLETRTLRRAALFINSGANAILLVTSKILDAVCHQNGSCPLMSRARYFQILITVEVVIAVIVLIVYLARTVKFNKAKAAPDFLSSASSSHTSLAHSQIGYRPAFDMQTWAMKQCWNEVWQLRHGCSNLIEEKLNLLRCVQQQRHINSATIN